MNLSMAKKAGVTGMAGALLWMVTSFLNYRYTGDNLPSAVQLAGLAAQVGVAVGFWGLVWGGGAANYWGKTAVTFFSAGMAMTILAHLFILFFQAGEEDSLIFILLLFGILFNMAGALLSGIVVYRSGQWSGWQRMMPMWSFVATSSAVVLSTRLGLSEAGARLVSELVMGLFWFGVGLAVYTAVEQQQIKRSIVERDVYTKR